MKERLHEKLEAFTNSKEYPFHMPGHKRTSVNGPFDRAMKMDITEIEGFDNLHHPEDILKEEQEFASQLYQSKKTFFLVNGSTCGVLAAICATTKKGDAFILARNSHKSAYNAVFMNDLRTYYVYPQVSDKRPYIPGKINAGEVAAQMDENNANVVFLTSPTYEGILSDIAQIAEAVHKRNGILIVDEAHGAHLGFHESLPKSAITEGADIVIQSMHKTLPSLTQTALLHICSDRVSSSQIAMFLSIFQTSSPSYVLMGSMSYCTHLLQEKGKELFDSYIEKLEKFYGKVKNLKNLKVLLPEEMENIYESSFDPSKINICAELVTETDGKSYGGKELAKDLLEKYSLQMEMTSQNHVIAMTSICDTQEGFDRLEKALFELDKKLKKTEIITEKISALRKNTNNPKTEMSVKTALEAEKKRVMWTNCTGKISAEYIYLYPPGSPIITPGEEISEEIWQKIEMCKTHGLNIQGPEDYKLDTLWIAKK